MFPATNKKKNAGISIAFPDVCKTPSPGGPVPIPYPNISIASSNLKTASVKIKKFKSEFTKTSGDEAGTMKGVLKSVSKISTLFVAHSSIVKATGKKATTPLPPAQSAKVFKQAVKQQKTFESKVKKECNALLNACKGDAEQEKAAKAFVSMIGSAARGHPVK